MSENKGIAGIFAQAIDLDRATKDHMTQYARHEANRLRRLNDAEEGLRTLPFNNVDELREFVKAIVRETLEEDARAIRERKEFHPVKQAGTCCACLMAGEDMAWVGNRLAHKTDECRRKAAEMEPVREHRG